jgi:hypothetical protein
MPPATEDNSSLIAIYKLEDNRALEFVIDATMLRCRTNGTSTTVPEYYRLFVVKVWSEYDRETIQTVCSTFLPTIDSLQKLNLQFDEREIPKTPVILSFFSCSE